LSSMLRLQQRAGIGLCRISYEALPLAQSAVLAIYLRTQRSTLPFFLIIGVAGIAGCTLYHVMPVVGPAHIFGTSFVSSIHRVIPLTTTTPIHPAPRNGMPSLHLAWALLILWNLPLVAVPFAFCIQSTCFKQWNAGIASAAVTLVWVSYLKFGLPYIELPPAACWMASLLTVGLPLVFGRDFASLTPIARWQYKCSNLNRTGQE